MCPPVMRCRRGGGGLATICGKSAGPADSSRGRRSGGLIGRGERLLPSATGFVREPGAEGGGEDGEGKEEAALEADGLTAPADAGAGELAATAPELPDAGTMGTISGVSDADRGAEAATFELLMGFATDPLEFVAAIGGAAADASGAATAGATGGANTPPLAALVDKRFRVEARCKSTSGFSGGRSSASGSLSA